MYAWRNLQGQSIVAAFMNMRTHQSVKSEEKAPKKLTPNKATPTKLHSA